MAKPRFISDTDMIAEDEEIMGTEVNMRKTKVYDSKPVHYGCAILAWSKLHFMKYVHFYDTVIKSYNN